MRVLEKQKLVHKSPWSTERVQAHIEKYSNGRLAIELVCRDRETGMLEPYMTCSVNFPEAPCGADEVFIKDWSENEGIVPQLIAWGLIEPQATGYWRSGFVTSARYKLTPEVLKKVKEQA